MVELFFAGALTFEVLDVYEWWGNPMHFEYSVAGPFLFWFPKIMFANFTDVCEPTIERACPHLFQ